MNVHHLLDGLGGNKAVADALEIGATAVSNWRLRGEVPARFHLAVWRMAIAAGLDWQPPGAEGLREALCPVPAPAESTQPSEAA
jgi:hypothetical protein